MSGTWCFASFSAASGDITLTQSPAFLSVPVGGTVSLFCKADQSVSDYVTWYHQKPGHAPKILIYDADNQYPGVPARFTGVQSGTEFTLKISSVQAEDKGTYYCQQDYIVPHTVAQT